MFQFMSVCFCREKKMKENQTIVMQQQILTEKKNLDQMRKKGILYLIILYRVVSTEG